jgi:thioredoxin 1
MNTTYSDVEPKRAEIDQLEGAAVVEFGSPWCGYCRRAQPLLAQAFAEHPKVRHFKIADASGKRLGRSFGVKRWPTLVFLRDGKELARLVRPPDAKSIAEALERISAPQ